VKDKQMNVAKEKVMTEALAAMRASSYPTEQCIRIADIEYLEAIGESVPQAMAAHIAKCEPCQVMMRLAGKTLPG
jgi:hypothetical protein